MATGHGGVVICEWDGTLGVAIVYWGYGLLVHCIV